MLAWWDYGYWIISVGRRIPVTNPTQINADAAADFFLSQSETEAAAILGAWHAHFVVLDERLPLWPSNREGVLLGDFPAFFKYSRKHNRGEYYIEAYEPSPQGPPKPKVFYLPAYYRSALVRLFVFGGKAVAGGNGATLLTLRQKTVERGRNYQEVVESKRFESAEVALAAEAACQKDGCVLVGEDPTVSCVPLEPFERFRPVFGSSTSVIGFGSEGRRTVQVYELTDAGQ